MTARAARTPDRRPAPLPAAGEGKPPRLDAKLAVIAIGGNATYPPTIRGSAEELDAIIEQTCEQLVPMIERGYRLVLTHGNGPVIGNIMSQMAATTNEVVPMPMDVCVAYTQGGIGYMIQKSLGNCLRRRGLGTEVACVVTQVAVDAGDPAFHRPTKPVGRFETADAAERIRHRTGWQYVEDAGRGYRRVVPSPKPLDVIELGAIRALLDAGMVPIAVGGGGIPVVRNETGGWRGAPAVIDKDLASAVLAAHLGAGTLIILTGVDKVARDFGKPTQRLLDRLGRDEAEALLAEGQFPRGSMGPKIAAALYYLDKVGGHVVITSLAHAVEALDGRAGTRIVP
jgi:carbamate kinase